MINEHQSRHPQKQAGDVMTHATKVMGDIFRHIFAIFVLGLGTVAIPAFGQQASTLAGDYAGMLGSMHMTLHLIPAPNGSLTGTVDSPDQGTFGVPCTDVRMNGQSLSFTVPMFHGAWTGFISSDGDSMSGTYNQGQPMPLNWARVTAGYSTIPSPGVNPTTSATATSPTLSDSLCPTGSMGNYWDGSSWKPLTLAMPFGKERGFSFKEGLKNPINPMGGYTIIKQYKGASAVLTLGRSPKFCFPLTVNMAPNVVIGVLDVKKDDREIEIPLSDRRNATGGFPARKSVEVNVIRASPTSIEVAPKNALVPGQYIINSSYMEYDFGVR